MKTEIETLVDHMISKGILLEEALKEFEKNFILNALNRHDNNLSKAATALGIHRNTLSKRLSQYQAGASAMQQIAFSDAAKKPKAKSSLSHRQKK